MSKKNGKKSRNPESTGASTATDDAAPRAPRQKLTVPEKLLAKATAIYKMVEDVHRMATFYGLPGHELGQMKDFLTTTSYWQGNVKSLVEGGWQPVVKGPLKDLVAGDKIAIKAEARKAYAYIPETVALAVGDVERSANQKIKRVLLSDERAFGEGVPAGQPSAFGWVPLAHLERR